MKKSFVSISLVIIGASLWFFLSMAAHQSMRKWDGKFVTVLRDNLSESGFSDEDVIFSVNETQVSQRSPWATQNVEIKKMTPESAASLKRALEEAGARVEETSSNGHHTLMVRRGHRLYQKITYSLT